MQTQYQQPQYDDDISYESSSNSSKTSKIGQNDALITDMGTAPLKVLVIKYFVPNFIFHVMRYITCWIELALVDRTFSVGSIYFFAIYQPLCDLLAYDIPYAITLGASFYVARNLAKNQLVAANIYFMHYFLMSFLYCIVVLIFYTAFLKNYFNENVIPEFDVTIIGVYSMIRCPVACFINLLNYTCISFLQAEARYFFLITKEVVENFVAILAMIIMVNCAYDINEGYVTLDNMAYGFLVGYIVGTIAVVFSVWKIKFLDVYYKGALFFNLKRLSPVRPKIILQNFWAMIPFLGIHMYDITAVVNAVFLGHERYFSPKQVDQIAMQHIRSIVFTRIRLLLKAFLLAFRDVFYLIAGYNMQIKKLSRIFESFWLTLAYQYGICLPIFGLLVYFGMPLVTLVYDQDVKGNPYYWDLVLIEINYQVYAAAWGMFLPMPFYLAVSFLLLEYKIVLAIAIYIPAFAFGIVCQYYQYKYNGDNADYLLPLVLGDVFNALFGYAILSHFMIKYYRLYKMNRTTGDVRETKLAEANIELRESMLQQLDRPDEDEEEEQAKRKYQPGKVFNKDMALRSSKYFTSLRESIARRSSATLNEGPNETPQ